MARRSWRIHLLKFRSVPSWGADLFRAPLRRSALRSFSENRKRFAEKLCALRGILKIKKCRSRSLSEPAVFEKYVQVTLALVITGETACDIQKRHSQ